MDRVHHGDHRADCRLDRIRSPAEARERLRPRLVDVDLLAGLQCRHHPGQILPL